MLWTRAKGNNSRHLTSVRCSCAWRCASLTVDAMALWLIIGVAATAACTQPTHFSPKERWVKGDYAVKPVDQRAQSAAFKRLGPRAYQPVSLAFARAITGNKSIPTGRNYYLTRVTWFSDAPRGTVPGSWVQMGVDVDSHNVAYLTSNLLTHAHGTSEFAAILVSSVALRGVVPLCRGDE